MTLSNKPYRGTRDLFPPQIRIQDYIFDKMKNIANLYGFEHYNGPLLEEVELYKAKSGEELINDQIYSFTDRGNRFVAIRPEMTPTLARMISQTHRQSLKPIRWYSIPNLMRYEKPQRGRLREHWQLNVDSFGISSPTGVIEILNLLINLLQTFGASSKQFCILLNNRKIVDHLLTDKLSISKEQSYKLYKLIDRSKKITKEKLESDLLLFNFDNSTNSIILEYLNLTNFEQLYAFLKKQKMEPFFDTIQQFTDLMKHLSLSEYILYDPTIVRGLDYYTGFVFELFDKNPENPRAICGGGEYENLLKIFNEDKLAGVGFGLGDVTLTDFLQTHNLLPNLEKQNCDLYLSFQDIKALKPVLSLANSLRSKQIKVINHPEILKFKKVFSNAEKVGARFVAMIGTNELDSNLIQIKDMNTREQFNVSLNDTDKISDIILNHKVEE